MFEESNGVRLHYELRGEGDNKVVLLHGWGCDSKLMEKLAESLQADHCVLLLDFPGHGESSEPPEPWGVPEFAECLRSLLKSLDFCPCAAVGHSFGCRVAALAASKWHDMFTKLVFTGAAGIRAPLSEEGKKKAEEFQRKKRWIHWIEKLPGLKNVGNNLEERLRQKYGSADYKVLDPLMRQTFVKVIQQDLRECYPHISSSTLLIWGDEDTETPLWMGREMEKMIPDAGLVILEGGSHFAYLEQAQRFNLIVRHFLTEE